MTHTQNSLSFEQALIDSILCANDGCENILVGAADEVAKELYNMQARLNIQDTQSAYGASFFILSTKEKNTECVTLLDVASLGLKNDLDRPITEFLKSNDLSEDKIDLVFYSSTNQKTKDVLINIFGNKKLYDFQKLTGTYFTNSAFAMHHGIDILLHGDNIIAKRILICNNLIPENIGLILLAKQD